MRYRMGFLTAIACSIVLALLSPTRMARAAEVSVSDGKKICYLVKAVTCNNIKYCYYACEDGTGKQVTMTVPADAMCPATISYGSLIDDLAYSHTHIAVDWGVKQATPGCSSCGGGGASNDEPMALDFTRRHRFRDITEPSSFGPGVFQTYDISMSLARNGGANRIRVFHPFLMGPIYLDDGLNFNGNGDVKDGVYVDSYRNMVKDLRLTDAYGGAGNLVTDIFQAKSAVMRGHGGKKFHFDVFGLGTAGAQAVPGTSVWQHVDIGAVASPGSASFGPTQDLNIQGAGADYWNTSDGGRFVYQTVSGDFEICARLASVENTNAWAKAGLMVRQSTAAGSVNVAMVASATSGYNFQSRTTDNGTTASLSGGATDFPNSWVRLKRVGNRIYAYRSVPANRVGGEWEQVGRADLATTDPVLVGMCVTSHLDGTLCAAQFRNVTLNGAVPTTAWTSVDIGTTTEGSTTDLGTNDTFVLKSSGADLWNRFDEGHLVYRALRGDGTLTARIGSLTRTNGWAKIGVMFRESLSANSKYAFAMVSSDNGTAFQRRTTTEGQAVHSAGPLAEQPEWVRLVRAGDLITGFCSTDGQTWTELGSETIVLPQDIFVGLAGTSHFDSTRSTATLDSVTLEGTPTPANEWPATGLDGFLAGRLTRIEDRNGYATTLSYRYNPAGHPDSTPEQQAAIAASPDRQWQLDTVSDPQGRQLQFTYASAQESGRWVVSQVLLPNGEQAGYEYADGKLARVLHADGTVSTFSATYDPESDCTVMHYDDAAAEGSHRRKDAYLSNNFSLLIADHLNDLPPIWNSASMLIRMLVWNETEVAYLNAFSSSDASKGMIYSRGTVREIGAWARQVRYLKDGWTFTPSATYPPFQGTFEEHYIAQTTNDYWMDFLRHRPSQQAFPNGQVLQYEYTSDDRVSKIIYADQTTEEFAYDSFQQVTRHKDRLNRVTINAYDPVTGNLLKREVGIACIAGVDTPMDSIAEHGEDSYAVYRWAYYQDGPNKGLLQTVFDPLNAGPFDANNRGSTDLTHRTDYEYYDNHQLKRVVQGADEAGGLRGATVYTYDTHRRLKTVTDPIGRVTTYYFDLRDRCEKIQYNDQTTERFFYGSGPDANLLTMQKDRLGNVTKFEYDNVGRKVRTVYAYGTMDPNDNLTEIADPSIRTEEVCTYQPGTTLKKDCTRAGEKTEYTYDYRNRSKSTTSYPRHDVGLTGTNTYVGNLLFCSTDPYGRSTYYAYRDSDKAMVRVVRGLVPGFTLADFAAVTALQRNVGNNPDYTIEDYELDAEGQRLATLDAKGIVHRTEYDSRGQVTAQVEAYGVADDQDEAGRKSPAAKTSFTYDAQGNRTLAIAPRSFTVDATGTVFSPAATAYRTQMTYNGRNMTETITRAVGLAEETGESYAYTLDGRLAERTDGRGNDWLTYYSNCCGYHKAEEDPTGAAFFGIRNALNMVTHQYTVADYDAVTNRSDPTGTLNEITTRYDARLRPEARTVWMVEAGAIDKQNPPIATDPAQGLTTRWSYDESLTDSIGLDATYSAYLAGLGLGDGADGSAVLATEPGGEQTLSIMDGLGRTVRTVRVGADVASSIVVDTVYDEIVTVDGKDLVQVKSIRYPQGLNGGVQIVTSGQADGAGLTRQSVDAEARASTMEYDPNANLVHALDPNDVGFTAVFDSRNREIKRTDTLEQENAQGVTPIPVRIAWREFDRHSNVVKTKDAREQETTFIYDGLDRRIQTSDRIGGLTTFKFDANSNLVELKDADAHVAGATQPSTVYRYNSRNLLVLEAYRDQAVETNYSADEADLNQFDADDRRSFSYDAARRMTGRVDQSGVATGYLYDRANRLTTRSYPDSLNDTFAFDEDGRLVQATSGRYSNVIARNYDNVGRLASEQLTIGGQNYTLFYGFDAANRRVSETYPNGQAVARAYTPRDQLSAVEFDGASVVPSFIYDLGGRETSRTLGNGIVQSRTWRGDNLPKAIVTPNVLNLGYTWDENKRKVQEENLTFAGHTNNYTGYDNEDRLTGWQRDGVGDSQSWELSKVGDWNTTTVGSAGVPPATEVRTHNAVHEIVSATPPNPAAQLVHDVKGNLTHNKNGQDYAWDNENRLGTATVPVAPQGETQIGVAGTHTYSYDALGRRVSKTVGEVTTVYVNNADWQEVAEYSGTAGFQPALVQSYVFGSYIDEVLCMVKANGDRFFYSTNDLYSVYALTDGAGTVVERYTYDPYGAVTIWDGNAENQRAESVYGNPWTFTGRRLDGETGLMQFRNRMFDVELGRFISRDPLGYVDGYGLQGAYFVPWGTDPNGTRVSVEYLDKNVVAKYDGNFQGNVLNTLKYRSDAGPFTKKFNMPDPRSLQNGYEGFTSIMWFPHENIQFECQTQAKPLLAVYGTKNGSSCGCVKCVVTSIDFRALLVAYAYYTNFSERNYRHELNHARILNTGYIATFTKLEEHILKQIAYGNTEDEAKDRLEKFISEVEKQADNRMFKIKNLSTQYDIDTEARGNPLTWHRSLTNWSAESSNDPEANGLEMKARRIGDVIYDSVETDGCIIPN